MARDKKESGQTPLTSSASLGFEAKLWLAADSGVTNSTICRTRCASLSAAFLHSSGGTHPDIIHFGQVLFACDGWNSRFAKGDANWISSGFPLVTGRCITGGRINRMAAYFISERDHKEVVARSKAEGEYEVNRLRQDVEYLSDFDQEIKRLKGGIDS